MVAKSLQFIYNAYITDNNNFTLSFSSTVTMSEPAETRENATRLPVPVDQKSDVLLTNAAIINETINCIDDSSDESDTTSDDSDSSSSSSDDEETDDKARDTTLFEKICLDENHSEHEKFLHAVASGDSRNVRTFLAAGVDVNERTEDGLSAILIAAAYRDRRMVKLLIHAKAEVNHDDPNLISLLRRFRDCKTMVDVFVNKIESQLESVSWHRMTFLQWAASINDTALMKLLLLAGANTNTCNEKDLTALTMAAQHGHVGPVQLLIRVGVTKEDMTSALFMASEKGNVAMIELLLAAGVDVNAADEYGDNALLGAAQHNHAPVVALLVDRGARIDDWSHCTNSALWHASSLGNADMLKILLAAGAKVDLEGDTGKTPLMLAASSGNEAAVSVLINAGAEMHATNMLGHTALSIAVDKGHLRVMQTLIAAKAPVVPERGDLGYHAYRLLADAAHSGRVPVVKFLLEQGADVQVNLPTSDKWTPLMFASHYHYLGVMELLIAAKADVNMVNDNLESALSIACWRDREEKCLSAVQMLVKAGACVNSVNKDGNTPLQSAVNSHNLDLMKVLINAHADVNIKDHEGDTPLFTCAYYGYAEVTEMLLAAKARVDDSNLVGNQAIHTAVQRRGFDIARMLIDAKADVNARGEDGRTPLIFSVNKAPNMRTLLDARADMYACDDDGCTVLMHAAAFGCPEALHVLRDAILLDDHDASRDLVAGDN